MFWSITQELFGLLKGILTDSERRVLSELSKFEIFAFFRSSPLRNTFPKGIRLNLFQYEMRAIFTASLVDETLFNTVVYGSNETHIIIHNLKT